MACVGFDFNAFSAPENNEWVNTYNIVNKAMQNPLFFLMPILDTKLRWISPTRVAEHQALDKFGGMLEDVILQKRKAISNAKDIEENEKDLLTLMIEAEAQGEGIMSNRELKVIIYSSDLPLSKYVCRIIWLSFS